MENVYDSVENIMERGENAGYNVSKDFFHKVVKYHHCVLKGCNF